LRNKLNGEPSTTLAENAITRFRSAGSVEELRLDRLQLLEELVIFQAQLLDPGVLFLR
jgi:hypothetical protein